MNKSDPFGAVSPSSTLMTDQESDTHPADEPVTVEHIGALLCATRMRLGGDLQEIAKTLRIRYGYLVAIEDGRYEDLPGAAYSAGFVRAYADFLGLDGNEVVRRLREESAGTVKTARYEFPRPSGESGLPNAGLLAIAIGLGMIVYGAWYTTSATDRDAVDLIQEVPERLAVLLDDGASVTEGSLVDQPVASTVGPTLNAVVSQVPDQSVGRQEITTESIASEAIDDVLTSNGDADQLQSRGAADSETETADLSETASEIASVQPSSATESDAEVRGPEVEQGTPALTQSINQPEQIAELIPEEGAPDFSQVAASGNEDADRPRAAASDMTQADQNPVDPLSEDIAEDKENIETAVAPVELFDEQQSNALGETSQVAQVEMPSSQALDVTEPDPSSIQDDTDTDLIDASQDTDETSRDLLSTSDEVEPASIQPARQVAAVSGEAEDTDLTIELRAKSDSWIQVRDGNDLLLTRLLRQGEVYTVPDRNGLTLMTGNAGGLEVFVDGELMPPLGDVGVVRRGVPLSADRLKIGVEPG